MTPAELLTDAFERIVEGGRDVVHGLDEDQLTWRPGPDANPIGWLVWHLARVQDDHVAEVAGLEQVWTEQGFEARFGLPFDTEDIGFGQTSQQVGQFRASAGLLASYLTAVHERTLAFLATITPDDLDRVVDDYWDPPVTLGVRLVSVVNDDAQHMGQAAYVRGLLGA
ncbi:MAG TPA: DUF664 domain-containing protein [Nocardioides sp.]|nr:DUF664 domain-containing protein [Nocardioides sp.]